MSAGEAIHGLGTDSKAIEDYYEEWGPEKYEANLREWGYTAPTMATKLVVDSCAAPLEAARVLDAGCGSGFQIADFQAAGFAGANVSGIDIWQGGLDQAAKREYYQSLTKVDLQAAPYPFDDDTFDAVVSVGVLTYLRPDSACLSEFIRVTKPGGIICYSNRTDKLDLWAPVEKALEDSGQWALVGRSERLPYLPKNSEFNTETEIVISTWRKI